MSAQKPEREVRGAWCQLCGPGRCNCYTRCYLEDGRWTHVEGCPDAANNGMPGSRSLCAKGMAAPAVLDSSERLMYPMRRVGPKGPGARFERISWDEALGTIARTLLEQKERFGAKTFGLLSPQFYLPVSSLGRRLLNVHGSPNYLHSGICHEQRHVSISSVLGRTNPMMPNSTVPVQLDKTELLVNWGRNLESSSVNHGGLRDLLGQMKRGMKVIDIRPMLDPVAAKADIWLPIRPGTDLALALGFLHVICDEGLYDHDFVRDWCYGFNELKEYVRQFTPEWASQRCGIDADCIREVARMIAAAKPCGIAHGNGIGDQCRDGHWTLVAIELIGAICGNLGKPGGGSDMPSAQFPPLVRFNPFVNPLADRMPASEEDVANGWQAGLSNLVAPEFPRWYMTQEGKQPTSNYLDGLRSVLTGEPFPMRALFAQSTNPLSATRDPELVARALEKIDFYFVMDLYHNPSCDYADIILPAASQYECSHSIGMKNGAWGSFLAISQKLADPPGEAMSDWEFFLKLGQAMGYGEDFWHGDVEAYLSDLLAPTGYSLEQLRNAPNGILIPRDPVPGASDLAGEPAKEPRASDARGGTASELRASDQAGRSALKPRASDSTGDTAEELQASGSASGSSTELQKACEEWRAKLFAGLPHGKVQCVNDLFGGRESRLEDAVLPYLPEYRGPVEGLFETPDIAKDFPLIFSDVHAHRASQHSYYGDLGWTREYDPDPWVMINPKAARRFGIEDGDWVRIESPHGWCVLRARFTERVSPEVLMGRRGWWQPCPSLGKPGYGWGNGGAEVNVLYSSDEQNRDSFHSSMGKSTLVRIVCWQTPVIEVQTPVSVAQVDASARQMTEEGREDRRG